MISVIIKNLLLSSTNFFILFSCVQKYEIQSIQSWPALHHDGNRGCSCTCVAASPTTPDLVSVGEDGRINVVRLEETHPVRTIGWQIY